MIFNGNDSKSMKKQLNWIDSDVVKWFLFVGEIIGKTCFKVSAKVSFGPRSMSQNKHWTFIWFCVQTKLKLKLMLELSVCVLNNPIYSAMWWFLVLKTKWAQTWPLSLSAFLSIFIFVFSMRVHTPLGKRAQHDAALRPTFPFIHSLACIHSTLAHLFE